MDQSYDLIEKFTPTLSIVSKDEKYGIVNNDGLVILPIEYNYIFNKFYKGTAVVMKDNKYGYINYKGKVLIRCVYDKVTDFEDDYARVCMGRKWGIVHYTGKVRLLCNKYNLIRSVASNVFVVGISYRNLTKYGAVDIYGNEIIPCKYDWIGNFKFGNAIFNLGGKINKQRRKIEGGSWGLLTSEGVEKIHAGVYDCIYDLQNYSYIVRIKQTAATNTLKYGALDHCGNQIIPCIYDSLMAFDMGFARFKSNDKWGVIDKKNKIIIEPIYDYIFKPKEGYATTKLNDKYGFIDFKKGIAHPPTYDRLSSFSENACVAGMFEEGKLKYGYIGHDNEVRSSFQFDKATNYQYNEAYVEMNGMFNYLDIYFQLKGQWKWIEKEEEVYIYDDHYNNFMEAYDGDPDALWNTD